MERLVDKLISVDVMKYVIIATLSGFEVGTEFKRTLRDDIKKIYDESPHKLLKENRFNPYKQNKDSVDYILLERSFGNSVGLTNLGYDFRYRIEPELHELVVEARGVLSEEDFNYFAELGKRLEVD